MTFSTGSEGELRGCRGWPSIPPMMAQRHSVTEHPLPARGEEIAASAHGMIVLSWILHRSGPWLFALAIAHTLRMASVGWGNTLNEAHSFRQSQTATTAFYMVGKSFTLAYETPVLGKPWAIPLEFPLYQLIVARIVDLFDSPLDQTGRFVALMFFLLTNIPLYRLVRAAGVSANHAWLPLILFTISPYYVFWSRAFMIESTGLFFSVAYLATAIEASLRGRWRWVVLAAVLGAVAAAVKVTTFLLYLAVVVALLGAREYSRWTRDHDLSILRPAITRLLAMTAIPFLTAVAWVRFTDSVKSENPLAALYLTSKMAHDWNYGTIHQKFSGFVWTVILGRAPQLVGGSWVAWLVLGAALAVTIVHRRRWRETLACLSAYLLGPIVFTNVYFVHNYYANANGIFLILAVAFALVGLLEDVRWRGVGALLMGLTAVSAGGGYWKYAVVNLENHNDEVRDVGTFIRSHAPEGSVIVCIGCDWSPLVSYYAQRRALNLPMDPEGGEAHDAAVAAAIRLLEGENVGAIVVLEPVRYPPELAQRRLREAGFDVPVLTLQGLQRY